MQKQKQEAGDDQDQVVLDLVALLDAKREDIVVGLAEVIRREMPDTTYGQFPVEEIQENNRAALSLLRNLLLGTDSRPPEWTALPNRASYFHAAMRIDDLVQAVRRFSAVLTPMVSADFPPGSPGRVEAMLRLEAGVDKLTALVVTDYAAELTQYIKEPYRRTEVMLDMARAASASLDLHEVVRNAARGIASAAGAEHSSICLIDNDGITGTLWPGNDTLSPEQAQFLGPTGQRMVRLSETTFVRRVLAEKKVVVWSDVQDDPAVGEDLRALGMRSVLGVPCVHNERILAVAFVMDFDAPRSFTFDQVELAMGVANVVAPAIENARLHQKIAQLAIAEERARLAQELHDDLAQTLGAMQFHASLIEDLLTQEQVPEAQASILGLQDMISQAYVDVREAIFNLRSMASLQAGNLAALRSYLTRYEQHYGLAVQLQADEEAAGVLAGSTGVQVLRILQEALTNVRKHGQTPRTGVELAREGPWVRVSVQDEGQGFDPTSIQSGDTPHIGLAVMRERAEKVGGTLSIESKPGRGTRVELRVPYSERAS